MKSLTRCGPVVVLSIFFQFAGALAYSQEAKPAQKDQTASAQTQQGLTSEASSPARSTLAFGLAEDTPVKLKLSRTMSSHDAKVDEQVAFEVVEDVKSRDVVIIQRGGTATAIVTDAKPKSLTHSGKLNMNIQYVQLVTGEKVPLRATKVSKSDGQSAAMKGAMIATSLLLFPTPMLLSKDITIPQGTEITAYVTSDTPLDPAKFSKGPDNGSTSTSSITIKSTPDGADITVDGKFVGTTPSTIQLSAGEHKIVVSKTRFQNWERTMTVNANGSINLNAELEKLP
jgi:hypothetical protein